MIHIEASAQVGRPRNEVFEFLTNVENLPRWQSEVVSVERLTSGPLRIGAQFSETAKVGPWRLVIVGSVTDIKPNERFAFQARSSGPLDCEVHFDLQPVAGGTRVTVSGTARLKGFWRLLQPLLAGELRKQTRTELATMKLLLEAQPAPIAEAAI
jgi:uncharacterized protein YndB with AHSA1/START domain